MTDPIRQDDDMPEDGINPAVENTDGPTLDEALLQIAELNKQLAEANDKTLRAMAEAENTRRRAEKDRQDTAKFSVASFAKDLLSVADNLQRALQAIPAAERDKNEQLKLIYTGVEATERELARTLEKNGIKKIEALYQKFDPNLHEVIFEAPAPDKPAGSVIQVVETGYMIHERLLRPARVGVAKGGENADAGSVNQEI